MVLVNTAWQVPVKQGKQDGKQAGKQDKKVLQQEIANIVKLALKVPYKKKRISKEDYKNIMKHVVQKVRVLNDNQQLLIMRINS